MATTEEGLIRAPPFFQAEEKKQSRRPNLLLQMSPEPFFGPAAPDLCGNQQHGLLGEPGEGSLGGSLVTTCAKKHCHHIVIAVNLLH